MKVAITIDTLLERSSEVEMVEALLGPFPDAHIYTLAFNRETLLGPITHRPIHASFLTRWIKNPKDLKRFSFLIPKALENLSISCDVDLVIDISSGFSQGIKRCQKSKSLTYFYDFNFSRRLGPWWQSWFKKWAQKKCQQSKTTVVASSQGLKELMAMDQAQVITPFFDAHEFPLMLERPEFLPALKDFWVISTEGLNNQQCLELAIKAQAKKITIIFAGPDDHLLKAKEVLGEELFFGKRCDGELGPLVASSFGVMDFSSKSFATFALMAQALGRLAIVQDNAINRSLLNNQAIQFSTWDKALDVAMLLKWEPELALKARQQAMLYHPIKFKGQMLRLINQALLAKAPELQ